MQLSAKQYQAIKLTTVIILAIAFSQAYVYKNFLLAVILIIAGSLVLIFFRKKVKDIMVDERDYAIVGKAAAVTIQIYSWLAVIAMFFCYSLSNKNPNFYLVASTLAFSTSMLLFMSAIFYWIYNKTKFSEKKIIFSVLVLLLFIFLSLISLRFFAGEDDWMCQNGQWVKHGNPSSAAPDKICK